MISAVTLPLISVVTPSYNHAEFIEATLFSVLTQDYVSKEYVVIDGGSTDGSVDIIRRYADSLAYWVTEPDRGQSHAINKGFVRTDGEVLGWLNSDDVYLPGTLTRVAEAFREHPEVDFVYGDYQYIDQYGMLLMERRVFHSMSYETLLYHDYLCQPAVFFRRSLLDRVGPLDENLYYQLDWDLFLRMWRVCHPLHIEGALAAARLLATAKSTAQDSERYVAGTHLVQRRNRNRRFRSARLNTLWHFMCYVISFGVRTWAVVRDNPIHYIKVLGSLFPRRRFLRLWRLRLRNPF